MSQQISAPTVYTLYCMLFLIASPKRVSHNVLCGKYAAEFIKLNVITRRLYLLFTVDEKQMYSHTHTHFSE